MYPTTVYIAVSRSRAVGGSACAEQCFANVEPFMLCAYDARGVIVGCCSRDTRERDRIRDRCEGAFSCLFSLGLIVIDLRVLLAVPFRLKRALRFWAECLFFYFFYFQGELEMGRRSRVMFFWGDVQGSDGLNELFGFLALGASNLRVRCVCHVFLAQVLLLLSKFMNACHMELPTTGELSIGVIDRCVWGWEAEVCVVLLGLILGF